MRVLLLNDLCRNELRKFANVVAITPLFQALIGPLSHVFFHCVPLCVQSTNDGAASFSAQTKSEHGRENVRSLENLAGHMRDRRRVFWDLHTHVVRDIITSFLAAPASDARQLVIVLGRLAGLS